MKLPRSNPDVFCNEAEIELVTGLEEVVVTPVVGVTALLVTVMEEPFVTAGPCVVGVVTIRALVVFEAGAGLVTLEELVGTGTAVVLTFPCPVGEGDVVLTAGVSSFFVLGSVVVEDELSAALTVQEAARSSSAVHIQARESTDNFIMYWQPRHGRKHNHDRSCAANTVQDRKSVV